MRFWRRRAQSAPVDTQEGSGEPAQDPSIPGERPEGAAPDEPGSQDKREGGGLITETRAALAPVKKRHVLVASLGLMGVSAVGLLLFSGASMWWTSQPSFCDRCHVMNKYVDAWEVSSHKDVNCETCHLTPGLFGFVGGKIAGLQVVANYIRGEYEDYSFSAAVSNAACLQCHEEILEGNIHSSSSDIVVSHEDILSLGGRCLNCHSTVAHGGEVAFGSATHPTMDTCLECHNDTIAPLDCTLCHTAKKPGAADTDVAAMVEEQG